LHKTNLIFIFLLFFVPLWAQSSLTFPSTEDTGVQPFYNILIEACQKIGIEINFVKVPKERALYNVNAGLYDGETVRIAGIEKQYPNLLPINVSLSDSSVVAYTRTSSAPILSVDELNGKRIVIVRGRKAVLSIIKGHDVLYIDDAETAFQMIILDRADIFVDVLILSEPVLETMNFKKI